jgi:hypothetical protein
VYPSYEGPGTILFRGAGFEERLVPNLRERTSGPVHSIVTKGMAHRARPSPMPLTRINEWPCFIHEQ